MNSQHPLPRRQSRLHLLAVLSVISVTWAMVPPAAPGQGLVKGTEQTFEAATWNIEWFGGPNGPSDDARQVANVTYVMQQADIDLWAVQEIADEDAFNTLVTNLGAPYEGRLAPTSAQQGLGLGFIFKTDIVQIRRVEEILTEFSSDFAGRPPFQLKATISTGGAEYEATFIVVHMKATSDIASYDQRVAASGRLKNHIDFTGLTNEPVFILGDLNDLLSGSITGGKQSPYKNFVDDPAYATPSLALQLDGRNTFCFSSGCLSGSAIDHIILSNEAEPWYISDSVDHFDELINEITSYVSTTSDHLPVLAAFTLTSTAIDEIVLPSSLQITAAYPNPFGDRLVVDVSQSASGVVDARLIDVLGRTVRRAAAGYRPAGRYRLDLETGDVAPGLYLLTVSTPGGASATRTVVGF